MDEYSQAHSERWNSFSNLVSEYILPLYETHRNSINIDNSTIDHLIHELTLAILSAQEESIPKFTGRGDFIVTPLLRFLIKARNHFRRKYTRNHHDFDRMMHNILKRRAEQEKHNILNDKYNRILLDCNKDHTKIYKVIKNKRHVNLPHLNPIIPGNRRLTSPQSKAEALADVFEGNHDNNLALKGVAHSRLVNRTVGEFLNSESQPELGPTIEINEVASLI